MRAFMRFSTIAAIAVLGTAGCRVMHHQETAGQYVDDTTLSARAKAALVKDSAVKASDFTVQVYQGNVTLTGVASSPAEAKRAEADIKAIEGVKSVKNDVRVAETNPAVTR